MPRPNNATIMALRNGLVASIYVAQMSCQKFIPLVRSINEHKNQNLHRITYMLESLLCRLKVVTMNKKRPKVTPLLFRFIGSIISPIRMCLHSGLVWSLEFVGAKIKEGLRY